MTTIVLGYQPRCLIADRLVVKTLTNKNTKIRKVGSVMEAKIQVTEDRHFAYVFDFEQRPGVIPLVLNYLTRFENGSLGDDEVLDIPKALLGELSGDLFVLSKKHNYCLNLKPGVNVITIVELQRTNEDDVPNRISEALGLTGLEVFEAIRRSDAHLMSGGYDVIYPKDLVAIPKAKRVKA